MAAPEFGSVGTLSDVTTSTTLNVPVPSGVAAGDIIVVPIYVDEQSGARTVTPPGGFAVASSAPVSVSALFKTHIYWKRATGADAGNYTFTLSATGTRLGQAFRITGCVASGDPWDVTTSANSATNVSTTPAVSATSTVADVLLVHQSYAFNDYVFTPAAGFTQRTSVGGALFGTKSQAAPGASGSVQATLGSASRMTVWLGALKPATNNTQFFQML